MLRFHGSVMQMSIMANCKGGSYTMEDQGGLSLLTREEYSKRLLGIASFVADNYPQLFTAIHQYFDYVSAKLEPEVVERLLGQFLSVYTSVSVTSDLYCKQEIKVSDDITLELQYDHRTDIIKCTVFYRSKFERVMDIKSVTELCKIVQSFSGEVTVLSAQLEK